MLKDEIPFYLFINLAQRKQLLKFFVIFSTLIIIPVIISSLILYRYSNEVIENEVRKSNINVMNGMIGYMDENFLKVREKILSFSTNMHLNYLLSDKTYGYNYPTTYSFVKKELMNLDTLEGILDEIVIYFNASDVIMTREGMYDFNYYFEEVNKVDGNPPEYWRDKLKEQANYTISGSVSVEGTLWKNEMPKKMIFIRTTFPYNSLPKANLILFINENRLKDMISKYGGGRNFIIIDSNANIITAYGQNVLEESAIRNSFNMINSSINDIVRIKSNSQYYSVTCAKSDFTGWIYLTAVPVLEISNQSLYVKRIMINIILIFVLFGLVISSILTRKEYKPIDTLMKYINSLSSKNDEEAAKKSLNEYLFIKEKFKNMHFANERMKELLKTEMPFLQENFFYRVLKGILPTYGEFCSEFERYNVHFKEKAFTVVSVKLDLLNIEDDSHSGTEEFIRIRSNLISIIQFMFNQRLSCFKVEMDTNNISYIVNYKETQYEEMIKACNTIKDFFDVEISAVRITIGIGKQYHDFSEIRDSYLSSLKAISLRKISRNNEVVLYEESGEDRTGKILDIDTRLKRIMNSFMGTERKESIQHACELLDSAVDNNLSYGDINHIMKQLIDTTLQVLEGKGYNLEKCGFDTDKIYKDINKCISIDDYKKYISDFYGSIEELLENNSDKKKEKIIEIVVNYIRENYNKDIYLESIADELGMSSNYLSHFFKKYTGMSFSDYLGIIRVEKAKELLSQTEKSINDICFEVGYLNVSSFIRNFKKIEGISPGRYRKLI